MLRIERGKQRCESLILHRLNQKVAPSADGHGIVLRRETELSENWSHSGVEWQGWLSFLRLSLLLTDVHTWDPAKMWGLTRWGWAKPEIQHFFSLFFNQYILLFDNLIHRCNAFWLPLPQLSILFHPNQIPLFLTNFFSCLLVFFF